MTDAQREWRDASGPSSTPAASGGWPVERRLLYELQRACLVVERTNHTVDLLEWVRTLGRRPPTRPLPKTRWVDAHRRLGRPSATPSRLSDGHHGHALPAPSGRSGRRVPRSGPATIYDQTWRRSWMR